MILCLEHIPLLSHFVLTFCVCSLHYVGCRVEVPHPSGIWPLVAEAGLEACAGFLVGGIGACPLVGGVGFCPSGGQGHVKGYIFSSLLAGGRGYVSTLLVVWPEHAGC